MDFVRSEDCCPVAQAMSHRHPALAVVSKVPAPLMMMMVMKLMADVEHGSCHFLIETEQCHL